MIKISKFLTIGVLVLGLIFPGGTVFAHASQVSANLSDQKTALINNQPQVRINVVQPKVTEQVVIPSSAQVETPAESCAASAKTQTNLLQNTAVLNLNQPASCFSLAPARVQVAVVKLSVVSLSQVYKEIIVVNNPPKIFAPEVLPAPFAQTLPVLPMSIFILMAAFIFSEKRLKPAIEKLTNNIKASLTPKPLGVLRC